MGDLLDTILEILLAQGIAGAGLIVLGWVSWKLYKSKEDLHSKKEDLHILMYKAAEEDNQEKIHYLNQHIVITTKATEALSSLKEEVRSDKAETAALKIAVEGLTTAINALSRNDRNN